MPEQLDVNSLIGRGELSLKPPEHPDDRATRLEGERRDLRLESFKGFVIFLVFVVGMLLVGASCFYKALLDPSATEDVRRWSQTMLSSLLAGGASFVAGRKIGSK